MMNSRLGSPWVWLAAAVSIVAMTAFAETNQRAALAILAQLSACAVIAAAIAINAPAWRKSSVATASLHPAAAIGRTTRLTALVYGWGGLTMLAIYLLTPLRWQHGWQYGLAMIVVAFGNALYVKKLKDSGQDRWLASRQKLAIAVQLAALQGVAVCGAIAWLIASGKFDTKKGDWAANHIFLAGCVALAAISFIIVKTHYALTATPTATAET